MPTSGGAVVEGRPKSGRVKNKRGAAEEATPSVEAEGAALAKDTNTPDVGVVAAEHATAKEKDAGGEDGSHQASQAAANGHASTEQGNDEAAEHTKGKRRGKKGAAVKTEAPSAAKNAAKDASKVSIHANFGSRFLACPLFSDGAYQKPQCNECS
jgi:hypothetical protein